VRPAAPALVHERFRQVVVRAITRGDERHRAHLERLRAMRAVDGVSNAIRLADDRRRRQRKHEQLLAAARLRRRDAPTWPAPLDPPEPWTPPEPAACPRCGTARVADAACACAAAGNVEA
jgi:hypothetical protein